MIYQFKVLLKDIEPIIWRRFLVDSDITFLQLHKIVQLVMGWENTHLFEFELSNKRIFHPSADSFQVKGMVELDADEEQINWHFSSEGQKAMYVYDFGDDWRHELVLEKILVAKKDLDMIVPVCLEGTRNCPPEDCGGFPGYENMLSALSDHEHPEHEDITKWLGREFDPEKFDDTGVNRQLRLNAPELRSVQGFQRQKQKGKFTTAQLRRQLKGFSSDELVQLVAECYKLDNGIKDFLRVKFVGDRAVEELFYVYRERVKESVFPEDDYAPLSLAEAKKAIREFEKVSQQHPIYNLELKLYYVELGVKLTNIYADMYGSFYNSIESMYRTVVQTLVKAQNDELHQVFADRVRAVVRDTEGIGWGFHDALAESYAELNG